VSRALKFHAILIAPAIGPK